MSSPRRLRHDPAFRLRTGCDLSAEAELLRAPDLLGQRARLLSSIGTASAASGIVGLLAAGIGAAGGGLLLAALSGEVPSAAVPVVVPVPSEVQLIAPQAEPPAEAPAPRIAPAPVIAPVEEPEVAAPPEAPLSPIQHQLTAYDRGTAAMDRGAFSEAERIFADLLAEWPDGVLATEARLARLECLYRLERWADVIDAAEDLKVSGDAGADVIRMQVDAVEAGRSEP